MKGRRSRLLVGRRDVVGAEQKAIRIAIEERSHLRLDLRRATRAYFATSSHEISKYKCGKVGILKQARDELGVALAVASRLCRRLRRHGMNDPAEPGVGPNDRRARMAAEQRLHLLEVHRPRVHLGEGHVDVAMEKDDQSDLAGEIEDAIERRVLQACDIARHLRRDELLVDGELADADEDAGKQFQHAANVIGARTCRPD